MTNQSSKTEGYAEIDDSLIVDLGKSILEIQLTLLRRDLPEITSLTVHPCIMRAIMFSARLDSKYVKFIPSAANPPKISICGVEIIEDRL